MKYVLATLALLLVVVFSSATSIIVWKGKEGDKNFMGFHGCLTVTSNSSFMYTCDSVEGEKITLRSWENADCSGKAKVELTKKFLEFQCLDSSKVKMQLRNYRDSECKQYGGSVYFTSEPNQCGKISLLGVVSFGVKYKIEGRKVTFLYYDSVDCSGNPDPDPDPDHFLDTCKREKDQHHLNPIKSTMATQSAGMVSTFSVAVVAMFVFVAALF
mmetsp:Transcript_9894/g.14583  ORF Transcript_9894/g.14583 Transcript_9894/m.14583 type:complete len:214 (+) Transcript_9894:13-654(+)